MSKIKKWYEATTGGASVNAVAARAGLVQTTLARQLRADALSPESIVAVARAYSADVIGALIVAGVITDEDVRRHGVRLTFKAATDAEIAAEVMKRMGGDSGILDAPLS